MNPKAADALECGCSASMVAAMGHYSMCSAMNAALLAVLDDKPRDERVRFDGLDEAVLGVGGQHTKRRLLVYSAKRIVEALVKQGMSEEEADEWYEHNIACLWAGEGTPILVEDRNAEGRGADLDAEEREEGEEDGEGETVLPVRGGGGGGDDR